jgi:hypothetical protein
VIAVQFSADLRNEHGRPRRSSSGKARMFASISTASAESRDTSNVDFAFYLKCQACGAVYEMPAVVPMRRLADDETPRMEPRIDEDWVPMPSTRTEEGE